MLQVSGLYIYPIKSLSGISLSSAKVTVMGLAHDRRWMLIDENNRFISQREVIQMVWLKVSIEPNALKVTDSRNNTFIHIPFLKQLPGETITVTIWDDTCEAELVSKDADKWFSNALGINCRLVYMPDNSRRMVDQKYAPDDTITSFSDGYPSLLIGQASLDDLNNRLAAPILMDRFRPNIVFTGGLPYEEDLIGNFTINGVDFCGVKLCARCVLTTVDQFSGIKGKEPLKTLATYRLKNKKILFGQNLIHNDEGIISIGDELVVNSHNNDDRFIVNVAETKVSLSL